MARKQSRKAARKRRTGRPVTVAIGEQVKLRCQADFLNAVDAWRAKQAGVLSRPAAIQRLAEIGLGRTPSARPGSRHAKASEMAGRAIDRMSDKSATDDERASRKRQLLKGPKEFRDMRGDLSKPKGPGPA